MKKMFFFAAIASVAFASCTNDENIFEGVKNGREMTFVAADYVHQTRAPHDLNQTFSNSNYQVWAWYTGDDQAHIDALVVDSTNSFTTGYYWPDDSLDFAAISPANDSCIAVSRASGATTVTYTFDNATKKNDHKTNLMHADYVKQQLNAAKNNASVALGFRHALAKLIVNVHQNAGPTVTGVAGYEVVVKSLSFDDFYNEGKYVVTGNAQNTQDKVWTPSGGTTDWSIISTDQPIVSADFTTSTLDDYYVMPQNISDEATVNITFNVITKLTTGGKSVKEVKTSKKIKDICKTGSTTDKIASWYTNKVITYTFNINPVSELKPITFTATEEEWGTTGGSHTF